MSGSHLSEGRGDGWPDYAFDVAFDKDKAGRSFSCGPEIRASEARSAIESFRYGVPDRGRSHIDSVLSYPLTARRPQDGSGPAGSQRGRPTR